MRKLRPLYLMRFHRFLYALINSRALHQLSCAFINSHVKAIACGAVLNLKQYHSNTKVLLIPYTNNNNTSNTKRSLLDKLKYGT